MQSDEDIGKVAQATPVVVAKALELFMTSLIQESCNQARSRNAKRVSPAHLKQAVKSTEQFDFLVEMVEKYPDPVGAPVEASNQQSTLGSSTSLNTTSDTAIPSFNTEDSSDSSGQRDEESGDASADYQPVTSSAQTGTTTRSRTRANR